MPIPVTCQCGQKFAAPDNLAGKRVKCPKCGSALSIPGAGPAPTPAQPSGPPPGTGMDDLFDDIGLTQQQQGPRCPSCGVDVPPGAVICVSCGFNSQTGERMVGASVTPGGFDVSKMSEAEQQIYHAQQELVKNPEGKTGSDFGDGTSIWAYVLTIFLPLLFGLAVFASVFWGGYITVVAAALGEAFFGKDKALILPAIFVMLACWLSMQGWFQVTMAALEKSILHGLLSLIFIGLYAPFYAVFHWKECRVGGSTLFAGWWMWRLVNYSVIAIAIVRGDAYLFLMPLILLMAGHFIVWLGYLRLILIAFEENMTQGVLALFVPFYAIVYGGINWSRCKGNMILWIVGMGLFVLAVLIWVVLLFAYQSINALDLFDYEMLIPEEKPN